MKSQGLVSTIAPICVLGAGSWGTALAMQLARAGQTVQLWAYCQEGDQDQAQQFQQARENTRYLPGIKFPDNLFVSSDIEQSLRGCRDVLIVVPSHAFSMTIDKIKPFVTRDTRIIWGTKGLDPVSGGLLHNVVKTELGDAFDDIDSIPMAIISGPSFAKEVAQDLPTAITIAGNNQDFNREFANIIHSEHFRPYTNDDLIGVQIAGAMKNPIAVATGISDGLGLGANARCALITRGLVEITRLGIALGGKKETFSGLAGMGDLILTCTDDQSRNRRFGLALGKGAQVDEAFDQVGQVVEGRQNAMLVNALAKKQGISVPIIDQVCAVVEGRISAQEAAGNLLKRDLKEE